MTEDDVDWGVPDWTDASAYEISEDWDLEQWRWEFRRRSQVVRFCFSDNAIRDWRKSGQPVPKNIINHPKYKDFFFRLVPARAAEIGYSHLPNPAYSDSHLKLKSELNDSFAFLSARKLSGYHLEAQKLGSWDSLSCIGPTQIAIVFDCDKPLDPQLDGLRDYLEAHSHYTIKKPKRIHKSKWKRYLRVLDARAHGASYLDIARVLLGGVTAATQQTARDNVQQAEITRDGV